MNYIGSKLSLLDFLVENFHRYDLENSVFCDLFAGTGIVGYHLKNNVKKIISNDIEKYSYIILKNIIGEKRKISFDFPELKEEVGFITEEYAIKRKYFSVENAKKIDWFRNFAFGNKEEMYLLFCLLEASDKVANTASVYGAFLKSIKASAKKNINIKNIDYVPSSNENEVYNENASDLIKKIKGDILYLDPPYNSRQYGANYHLLNTIVSNNVFEPRGVTGLNDYNKSSFCSKGKVYDAMEQIISDADFENIFISYNNEGLIKKENFLSMLSKYGNASIVEKEYKRFKSRDTDITSVKEYLFILNKKT